MLILWAILATVFVISAIVIFIGAIADVENLVFAGSWGVLGVLGVAGLVGVGYLWNWVLT